MISIRARIARRWERIRRDWFLAREFRNGAELVRALNQRLPIDRAVCRDGTVLSHPPDRLGLAEALVEIWFEQIYTGKFYQPLDGDAIIDAGANVGLFSILLARSNPRCKILAIEPFRENYQALERNVHAAGATSTVDILSS